MSKCPHCKKDFKAGIKAAYNLGVNESYRRYQLHLNNITKTHRRLFDELLKMDFREPLNANRVYFSRKFLTRLLRTLRKAKLYYWYKIINRETNKQVGRPNSAEAKLRELLSELEE